MSYLKQNHFTVKREMFLLSFSFLALVSLLFAGMFLWVQHQSSLESAKNALRACNTQVVTYTEGMFHENATVVELLSQNQTIIQGGQQNRQDVLQLFNTLLRRNSNITYVYSGYSDGSLIINSYNQPPDYNATTRPWYQAAAATDGVARLVYRDASTQDWLFSQCMKLTDENGRMVGAIAIDCSNESITRQLSTRYQYDSQRSFILDYSGTVLIHPNEREINTSMRNVMDAASWEAIADGRSNYSEYTNDTDGIAAMAYFERIPQTNFIVGTAINAADITRPVLRTTLALLLLTAALSLGLSLLLSRILIQRIASPIMELGGRIRSLADGTPQPARDVRFSNAEINHIAQNIEVIVQDIANREEQRKAAEFCSLHDSMTGLYNRRFFEAALHRLDTRRSYPLCILCCDINGLKLTNDVFGHAVGDMLIATVAQCLQQNCRADDVLARVGGDEFIMLLPQTSEAEAQQLLQRIQAGFPQAPLHGAQVSASLGYAVKPDKETSMDKMLRLADKMMYDHKLLESAGMKRRTVANVIAAAEGEGLVAPPSPREEQLLTLLADYFCPDAHAQLLQSYQLRRLGLCTLVLAQSSGRQSLRAHHSEAGYRILSALDDYRGVAGCILHYTEHWDGTGWPAGLQEQDIPLLSRIIAVTEAWVQPDGRQTVIQRMGSWYDPALVQLLAATFKDA